MSIDDDLLLYANFELGLSMVLKKGEPGGVKEGEGEEMLLPLGYTKVILVVLRQGRDESDYYGNCRDDDFQINHGL